MCGRYYVELSDAEMKDIAKRAEANAKALYKGITLKSSGEIFPTDTVPVQTKDGFFPMKWGFATGKRLLINARFETFTEKPTFKSCNRCLIPASGYFEWKQGSNPKEKYAFSVPDKTLYLAGLYRGGKDTPLADFVILTRDAVGVAADIHHRMPVIVQKNRFDDWFSGAFGIADSLVDLECSAADNPGQMAFEV
jgi:putative SOS response-associated peptidase YedK